MDVIEWLQGDYVSLDDVGKKAVILGAELNETGKFGTKLELNLELTDINGQHQTKKLSCGKTIARDITKKLGTDLKAFAGKIGVIRSQLMQVQGKGTIEKAIFVVT